MGNGAVYCFFMAFMFLGQKHPLFQAIQPRKAEGMTG